MSIYYFIDSTWRDVTEFPNAGEFEIPISVAQGWHTVYRSVMATRSYCEKVPLNFVFNVTLLNLTLPVGFTFPEGSLSEAYGDNPPMLFVEFRNVNAYTDRGLINTNEVVGTDPSLKDAVFVAYFDKNQGGEWLQFKSCMTQTYRIDPKDAMEFRVFSNFNDTVQVVDSVPPAAPNPILALFQLTPYVREDTRESHFMRPC